MMLITHKNYFTKLTVNHTLSTLEDLVLNGQKVFSNSIFHPAVRAAAAEI